MGGRNVVGWRPLGAIFCPEQMCRHARASGRRALFVDIEERGKDMIDSCNKLKINGMWNPKGFIPLSVLFSFILPGILFIGNESVEKKRKIKHYIYVLLTGIIFLILAYILSRYSDKTKYFAEAINIIIGTSLYYKQKEMYSEHISNGGIRKKMLFPILIGIIPIVAIVIFSTRNIDSNDNIVSNESVYTDGKLKYKIEEDSIYYDKDIPIDDVEIIYNELSDTLFKVDGNVLQAIIVNKKDKYDFIWSFRKNFEKNNDISNMKKIFDSEVNRRIKIKKRIEFIPVDYKYRPI
jgi:hypothetical protein